MKRSRDSSGPGAEPGSQASEFETFLLRELPWPVLRFSPSGELLLANEAAAPLLKDWGLAVGKEVQEPWRRRIAITARTQRERSYEIGAAGYVFRIILLPARTGGGVTLLAQDMTVERTVGELRERENAARAGTARMAALGEMAAEVAHEINNPLAIIQAYAEELESLSAEGTLERDALLRITGRISETSLRIARIVGSLLRFARDPEGERPERATLASVVEMAATFCGHRLSRARIQFETRLPAEEIALECMPVRLSQVLVNLINNSYDAVSALEERWIRVEASVREGRAEIRVTDSGRMPPEVEISRLFDTFYTTKPPGKGTGLGLPIAREIALAHGGDLVFDTESPNTSFVLRLPLPK